jgi:hypothetical protein
MKIMAQDRKLRITELNMEVVMQTDIVYEFVSNPIRTLRPGHL